MRDRAGQVARVKGVGFVTGRAAVLSPAKAGMRFVLTGRGRKPLERTANVVCAVGEQALVAAAEISVSAEARLVGVTAEDEGRMLRADDLYDTILFVAHLSVHHA